MATITGGSITFDRNVKIADYEGKKASVTLSFGVSEADDDDEAQARLARVAFAAQQKCLELLGLVKAPEVSVLNAPQPPRVRRTKEQIAADEAAAAKTKVKADTAGLYLGEKTPTQSAKPPTDDVLDLDEPSPILPAVAEAKADLAAGLDLDATAELDAETPPLIDDVLDLTDDLTTGELAEVTDAELTAWVTARNAVIKNALAIRGLIAKYATVPPHNLARVPADKRRAFKTELDNLQPKAGA